MPYVREGAKRRWTVSMMKVYRDFCGWDTLEKLVESVDYDLRGSLDETLIHSETERDHARGLIATIFEAGARISEVIGQPWESGLVGLKTSDFNVMGDRVNVIFEMAKRFRKRRDQTKYKATNGTKMRWDSKEEALASGRTHKSYEGFTTERVIMIRNIVFPREEKLVTPMLDWVEQKQGKLFNISYNKAYRVIKAAGKVLGLDFPPHRLRAERATQLALEYGFDDSELTDWFEWQNPKEAHDYTTLAPRIINKMFRR